MSHATSRRTRRLTTWSGLLAAGLVLGALAGTPAAQAAPAADAPAPHRADTLRPATAAESAAALAARAGVTRQQAADRLTLQPRQSTVAGKLTGQLGRRAAGAYLDSAGRLVVAVTDRAAAAAVVRAGATARVVRHSAARLAAVKAALDRVNRVPSSTTAVDPAANRVELTIPAAADPAATRRVLAAAARYGSAVRVTRTSQPLATFADIAGGDAIFHLNSSGVPDARCSNGFNVTNGASLFVLTAGHCAGIGGNWASWDGTFLGPSAGAVFPGQDDGVIQNTGGVEAIPGVYLYDGFSFQPITGAGNSVVGQTVCKSGSTTGLTCGRVTAKNVTVTYQGGFTVTGLDQTNVCSASGDSGGSMFAGSTALGILSGGAVSGPCLTLFQPVIPALGRWGVGLI